MNISRGGDMLCEKPYNLNSDTRYAANSFVKQLSFLARLIKKIAAVFIILYFPMCLPAQTIDIEKFSKNIEENLKGKVVGAAWAIAQNGTVVKTGAIGYARTTLDAPELNQSADIRQNPASVGKTITAVGMLKLLKEKNISLQTSIKNYLPKYWVKGEGVEDITFLELLTHTSGLYKGNSNGAWSTSYIKDRIAEPVGSKVPNYANCNYSLLRILAAYILKGVPAEENINTINEHASNGLAGYIATKIMQPIGIHNFTTRPSKNYPSPLFYNTAEYKGTMEYGTDSDDWSSSYGGAGYYISAKELAMFLAALQNGKILSADQIILMNSYQLGLGWWYKPDNPDTYGTYLGHGGYFKKEFTVEGNTLKKELKAQIYAFPGNIQASLIINSSGPTSSKILREAFNNAFTQQAPSSCLSLITPAGFFIDKCSFNNVESYSGKNNGYGVFKAITFDATQKSAFKLKLSAKNPENKNLFYTIYIDKNNDKNFTANEKIYTKNTAKLSIEDIVYLPADLQAGKKILRICVSASAIADLCGNKLTGEIEDYTINVTSNPTADCMVKPKSQVVYIDKITINQYVLNSGDNSGYKDFTSNEAIEINKNQNYTFKLYPKTKNPAINLHAFSVWVDIDKNNIFEASKGELLYKQPNPVAGNELSVKIALPKNTGMGKTKMRVVLVTNGLPAENSCACSNYGEVEDYSINVKSNICLPSLNSSSLYISKISLGGITQESTQNNKGFTDYTIDNDMNNIQLSPPSIPYLKIGGYHKLEIIPKKTGNINQFINTPVKLYYKVWMDLNKNFIFEPGELLCNVASNNSGKFLHNIKTPANVSPGYYRMRVMVTDNASATACDYGFNGEAEDYTTYLSNNLYCEFATANKNFWIQKFSVSPSFSKESGNNNGYGKFLKDTVTFKPGSSYNFNIKLGKISNNLNNVNAIVPPVNVNIWIDFNKNKIFEGNEMVYGYKHITTALELKHHLNIPAGATKGVTIMRVLVSNNPVSPCGGADNSVSANGEAEDYVVNISDEAYCMNALLVNKIWVKKVVVNCNNEQFQNESTYQNGYEDFTSKQVGIFSPNDLIYVGILKGFKDEQLWCKYGAWIDYNQNFIFEPDEAIDFSITGLENASGIFKVPVNVKEGKTRMRVMVLENNNNFGDPTAQNACVNPLNQGEYEDYAIQFKGASCQSIINTKATIKPDNEVLVTWELNNGNGVFASYDSFEVGYKEEGDNTYIRIPTNNHQLLLKNLKPNILYTYFVVGFCKSGKTNNSGLLQFKFTSPYIGMNSIQGVSYENSRSADKVLDSVNINTNKTSKANIVIDNNVLHDIGVYPNPATTQLNMTFAAEENADATLTIVNTLGNNVLLSRHELKKGLNKITVNVTHLQPGLYIVKIQDGLKMHTRSVIIQ